MLEPPQSFKQGYSQEGWNLLIPPNNACHPIKSDPAKAGTSTIFQTRSFAGRLESPQPPSNPCHPIKSDPAKAGISSTRRALISECWNLFNPTILVILRKKERNLHNPSNKVIRRKAGISIIPQTTLVIPAKAGTSTILIHPFCPFIYLATVPTGAIQIPFAGFCAYSISFFSILNRVV